MTNGKEQEDNEVKVPAGEADREPNTGFEREPNTGSIEREPNTGVTKDPADDD